MGTKIGTILPPAFPSAIPPHSQWLLGEGAGAWFSIDTTNSPNQYNIKRFNPTGKLECDGIFEMEIGGSSFNIELHYQFTHVSHCAKCRIIQDQEIFVFKALLKNTQ
jgi:hypothetical protein